MDTVTYPDQAVSEILKQFVCIRVEFDKVPELVKQFHVEPLPDLRILDNEANELHQFIGFSSAKKLTGVCQNVLDQRAGRTVSGGGPDPAKQPIEVTAAAIEKAVQQGLDYLATSFQQGWPQAGYGYEEIALYAMQSGGATVSNATVLKLLKIVLERTPENTYQTAFCALALGRLEPRQYHDKLQECADFLCASQLENGQWTYQPQAGNARQQNGDHSNSAYALLGLYACQEAGIEVPGEVIQKAAATWRTTQNQDGGWGYRSDREMASYASMTENGISSLILCQIMLNKSQPDDAQQERAIHWLGEHYSVAENLKSSYQQGRHLYHLYALERLGALLKTDLLAGHGWYADAAQYLLSNQTATGAWDDGSDTPVPNTCFALLVLTKATRNWNK